MDGALALFNAVLLEPVESHIYCFASLLVESSTEDALAYFIVGGDWCWWLLMVQEFEGLADGAAFLAPLVGCANLCFSGGGNNWLDDVGDDMEGSVEGRLLL